MQRVAVLIFVACCALIAQSLDEPPSSMQPALAFDQSSTSTTTPAKTTPKTTTTSTTKTTPKTTTTSTTKTTPKTTTTSTTKTTPKTTTKTTPKTTPKTTTTTTTTTTTKTTPMTTTTAPAPTPATNLTVGSYNLTDKGVVCLKADVALKIRLESKEANGTFIVQPKETKANGECKETKANLTLVFEQGFITFIFNKSVKNNTVYVETVSFALNYPLNKMANQQYSATNNSLHLFPSKIGHSYSCRAESIYMGHGLYLEASQDRMQAFNITNKAFGYPDPCPADKPDYRIAIAVGVTLLVLIVIVVIVYLLGRRKRTSGYQSL